MKPIEELNFTDDYMFGHIMKNKEICKELLERLLKIKIDHLEYPELQQTLTSFYETKGVRLDVYVKDSNRVFDIEIQNSIKPNISKRCRYYQSMVDMDNLLKGEDYCDLKESYIIFICQFDPFNKNMPCYTFKNICIENKNLELNDQTTKIIFNSTAYKTEKNIEISAFLEYTNTRVVTDAFTQKIDNLVEQSKLNNKFRNNYLAMNLHDRDIRKQAFEEGCSLGIEQGTKLGIEQGTKLGIEQGTEFAKNEIAKNMIMHNLPIDQIITYTGLTSDNIEQIRKALE